MGAVTTIAYPERTVSIPPTCNERKKIKKRINALETAWNHPPETSAASCCASAPATWLSDMLG